MLLSESGTRGHRGFFASSQAATIAGGLVLAQACLLALLLISDRAGISEWGWWVAFVAGLASLWWARGSKRGASGPAASSSALSSSPKPASSDHASTMMALVRNHWRPLVWVILLTAGGSAAFYTATVTVPVLIRETFFRADGTSGELAAIGLVLAALVALMLTLAAALMMRGGHSSRSTRKSAPRRAELGRPRLNA